MKKNINGYTITEVDGVYQIAACDGFVVQTEPTESLAVLWTYAELYRVLKEGTR